MISGVEHCHAVAREDLRERPEINRERIDENQVSGPRDLNKRKFWEVGPLPMEFGIEGVTGLFAQFFDHSSELGVTLDDSKCGFAHGGSSGWRRATENGATAVDPTLGAAGHIDCVDSLSPEEFDGSGAATTESTNHIDR